MPRYGTLIAMAPLNPTKDDHPLAQFGWLWPILGSLVVSAVVSFVGNPVNRLERMEVKLQNLEVAKAATDMQIAGLKESLSEIKNSQIVLSGKIDDLKAVMLNSQAIQAAQSAARSERR